ncbi:hypothetical protein RRF57_002149 [Xylaria bambusicola]|uniref:Uncharacterized protein n=1 Tax=Xylaria bambusicola TaxID=326684 RepID=A0AAN7USA3_9PEZI
MPMNGEGILKIISERLFYGMLVNPLASWKDAKEPSAQLFSCHQGHDGSGGSLTAAIRPTSLGSAPMTISMTTFGRTTAHMDTVIDGKQ